MSTNAKQEMNRLLSKRLGKENKGKEKFPDQWQICQEK
jgi:hypothetical protein